MSFVSVILIATTVINFVLAWFIFIKKKNQKSNILYSLLTLSIAGWALFMYFFRIADSEDYIFLWGRLVYIFAGLAPYFFLMFAIFFPDNKRSIRSEWIMLLSFISGLFLLGSVWGQIIIQNVKIDNGVNGLVYGWGNMFYGIYILGYFLVGLLLLIRKFNKSESYVRAQLKLIIIGAVITLVVSFSNNVVLTFFGNFNYNWVGPVSTLIMVGVIAYAITRYRLMDIKTIIRKSTIFTFLVVSIGAIFIVLSSLTSYFIDLALKGNQYVTLISAIIVSIIIASIFQPLRSLLESITNKFLFTKAYSLSDLLSKINQTISSTIDLNKLLKLVSNDVNEAFHFSKIGFAFVNKVGSKERLKVYYQSGFVAKDLENFSKGKIDILPQYFNGNKEIKVIDELKAQYEAHEYQPKNVELLNGLYDLNISLVIPLFTKEKLIGVIVMGNKKSDDPYNSEDLRMLNIIAGQLGIAIENARLYEEQKNFNVHLKDEVQKATLDLEKANTELKRLDDAKSEFLSIASHQLRTPLTITKGYVSMMNEGSFGKIPKIIKENLVKIYAANERLLNLVENLLDISRIEAGRLEFDIQAVDMNEAVKSLVVDFQGKAKDKKLKLEFYPEPDLPKCSADAQKIKEVISNLIDNSIKYTKKGEIIVGTHQEGQSVVFTCQDTGMGIEPEDLPRLFNKFVRGKGMMTVHTEGTGLGLYFARVVIENMGGRIWTESPGKDRGSKFSFSLPMADKEKAKKIVVAESIGA